MPPKGKAKAKPEAKAKPVPKSKGHVAPKGKAKAKAKAAPPPPEVGKILDSFKRIDTNGDGTLDAEELAGLLTALNPGITADKAQEMFRAADVDGTGSISYVEFVHWAFGDFDESEEQLSAMLGLTSTSTGLKSEDPDFDDEFMLPGAGGGDHIERQLEYARQSGCERWPDRREEVQKIVQDAKTRIMSPEFESRVVNSFGKRIDADGSGTLSFEEAKGLISETLRIDTDFFALPEPKPETLKHFFDMYNTAAFGKEMGSSEFLNLMRGLNVHLVANLLPEMLAKKEET